MNNLELQKMDLTSLLVKGLNSLKSLEMIELEYYNISPFFMGGAEYMLADQFMQLIKSMHNVFKSKLKILLVSDVTETEADYYIYIKDHEFTKDIMNNVDELKPLYRYFLEFEKNWQSHNLELTTFNVIQENACCLLVSLKTKGLSA